MRLAGSIVTLANGAIGLIMAIIGAMAINSPEFEEALRLAAQVEGGANGEDIVAIARTAATVAIYVGVIASIVLTLMGILMFRSRSMALGIIAIVVGVLALFGGAWVTLIGGVVGGILFLVGRNS